MSDRPPTFNELLIQEVQNHPQLYDQQHRVCTDNEERNLMWEVIAQRIDANVTGEFAKKRWLQMRDRYRKELKMALRNMTQPKWPYFEKLSWLDPYLKDSKSTGLNPLFLSSSFESTDTNGDFDSGEMSEFPYGNGVNATALLENIMAASSNAFEQLQRQRENGEFSPDSAIASTSDEGEGHKASSGSASDVGSSHGSTSATRHSASPHSGGDSTPTDIQNSLEMSIEQPLVNPLPLSNDSFSFMGSVIRGLSAASAVATQRPQSRQRNPPYLVRRGGGVKVKSELERSTSTFSAFKPLAKTMSVGGLTAQSLAPNRSQSTTSVGGDSILEEWRSVDWANDEDMLFARLVVVRLKKFAAKEKRSIRSRISEFLDEKEEEAELSKLTNRTL